MMMDSRLDRPTFAAIGISLVILFGAGLCASTTHTQAETLSPERACVRAAAAAPKVLRPPTMDHAGVWPLGYAVSFRYERSHPPQALRAAFEYPALEPPLTQVECGPRWRRVVGGKFFLENSGIHGDPDNPIADPENWTNLTFGWQISGSLTDPTTGKPTTDGRSISEVDVNGNNTRQISSHFNRCVDGRFRRVDYVARVMVMDAETHQKVAQTFHVFKARVRGNCRAAARSAALYAGH